MPLKAVLSLIFLLAFLLPGCSTTEKAKKEDEIRPQGKFPRTVAVLPFGNETDEIGISGQIRKSFYNHFSSKPFRDIELSAIDEKVALKEKASGKTVFDISQRELAESVGAEAVIYGKVTDFKKVFALAYSQLGAEAEVWMVDARTGEELWRFRESVRYHEGGVPLSPMGAVMTLVSTAMNVREMQQIRVVNELGWKLNEKIPAPAEFAVEAKPLIKNVLSNAKEGPFGKGKVIKVAMEGEPGMIGLFEIGGLKKALPMKEVSPGEYLGEYLVVPGDDVKDAPVIAFLRRPSGEESRWMVLSGFLTIDTTPPPVPGNPKGRTFTDRIELSWDSVASEDLRGYRIMRSTKPLSDYSEAGFTEETRFADKTAAPREVYYYRIESVDAAGNNSAAADTLRLVLRSHDLIVVPSMIDRDLTLYAGGYLVKSAVMVAAGVTLTAEADAKIFFEKGTLIHVNGRIRAEGQKDQMVEFLPITQDTNYAGIFIGGSGSSLDYARVNGALAGVVIRNSASAISNSILEYNKTALMLEGKPSPAITGSVIGHNGTGVVFKDSKGALSKNEITHNGVGMLIEGSAPELTENNIYNNDLNVEARGASALDGNYLGSINVEEMRLKGDTKVAKALDAPYPVGKPVGVVVNPYSLMSDEERKARLTEFLVKGGRYFKERNFGKSATLFEEALRIEESPTAYYYLALSYQEMEEGEKALNYLKKGTGKFPNDSALAKAYGLLLYQLEREGPAKEALKEALRLNPGDRQIRFILERLEGK